MSLYFSSSLRRQSPLLRHLSTTTTTSISSASAKTQLRKTFDPDVALSLLSTSAPSSSPSSRFALDLTVRRLARSRRYSDIHSLLLSRLHSLSPPHSERFLSSLILCYATARMTTHAREVFDQISHPTSTSFNALLNAHLKSKKHSSISKLFVELPSKHPTIVADPVSFGILIKSFCIAGDLDKALEAFDQMKGLKGYEPNLVTYTTLIDYFYKKGKSEEGRRMWDEMVRNGCVPDVAAYNVKLMSFSMEGKAEEVKEVIRQIEAAGLRPDAISYNYLITCYCRSARVGEAMGVYRGFFGKNIAPNAAMFKMLVMFLCKVGEFDAGLEVFRDSAKYNKIPDFQTLKGLVEGLVEGGKAEEAREVVRVVKEKFPKELLGKWDRLEVRFGLTEVAKEVESEQGN